MLKGGIPLKIVKLQYEDFSVYEEKILDLLIETYSINFDISVDTSIELSKEKLSLLKTYVKENKAIVLVSLDENILTGFVWLHKHEFFKETRLHINQIAVDSQHRGKGIAKELLIKTEEVSVEVGSKIIDLFVSETNESAIGLYEKLGFKTERRYMKREL